MSKCISVVNHSKVKVEENKRKAVFINSNRENYEIGIIDGCLVKSGIRADYFVSSAETTVLVELKGTNIDHACNQLFAAVEHANVKDKIKDKVGFLIICSRVPTATTSTLISQQKAKRIYNAKLKIYCNQREVKMEDF